MQHQKKGIFMPNLFWDFSVNIYGHDGVPAACLALQENCEIDVNMILFCCWAGEIGAGRLDVQDLRTALGAINGWHREIVRGLRMVRNHLTTGFRGFDDEIVRTFRQKILNLELESERMEQDRLLGTISLSSNANASPQQRATDTAANLANYFTLSGSLTYKDSNSHVANILAACFSELPKSDIEEIVASNFESSS
jgi:uncharacterized protein (TIGR02444 family)